MNIIAIQFGMPNYANDEDKRYNYEGFRTIEDATDAVYAENEFQTLLWLKSDRHWSAIDEQLINAMEIIEDMANNTLRVTNPLLLDKMLSDYGLCLIPEYNDFALKYYFADGEANDNTIEWIDAFEEFWTKWFDTNAEILIKSKKNESLPEHAISENGDNSFMTLSGGYFNIKDMENAIAKLREYGANDNTVIDIRIKNSGNNHPYFSYYPAYNTCNVND